VFRYGAIRPSDFEDRLGSRANGGAGQNAFSGDGRTEAFASAKLDGLGREVRGFQANPGSGGLGIPWRAAENDWERPMDRCGLVDQDHWRGATDSGDQVGETVTVEIHSRRAPALLRDLDATVPGRDHGKSLFRTRGFGYAAQENAEPSGLRGSSGRHRGTVLRQIAIHPAVQVKIRQGDAEGPEQ
jgi:hypothetical protein